MGVRLDFSNPMQTQRLPRTQPSPSPQYSQSINNTYTSNSTVTTNNCKINKRIYICTVNLFNN